MPAKEVEEHADAKGRRGYLTAPASGGARHDLAGLLAGEISEDQRKRAPDPRTQQQEAACAYRQLERIGAR
jgi:hypothetical protein